MSDPILSTREIELVESSWDFVLINSEKAGEIFYTNLFLIDPSLKALFKGSIEQQAEKLVSLISFAVHKLRTLDEIVADVQSLGKRHAGYQVKEEYYFTVGNALMTTLAKGAGENWTEEVKMAWIKVYSILSETMINASRS